MNTPPHSPANPVPAADAPATHLGLLESANILGNRSEVLIRHCGQTYRLRRTRQDKLILTK